MTLVDLILERAQQRADRPFLIAPGQGGDAEVTTFGEVLGEARRVQGWLEERGEPGRAAIVLPNGRDFVVALFGALLAGWTAVPIDPRLKAQETRFILAHTGCQVVIEGGDLVGEVRSARVFEAEPSDPAVILATSGSTADPKAVMLSHRNIVQNLRGFQERYRFSSGDVFLTNLAFYHSFGLTACLFTALEAGASIVLIDDPQPVRVSALAARHAPTAFFAAASFYQYLVRGAARSEDFSNVRGFLAGACSLPGAVADGFRAKFGRDIVQTYGLTEASPVVTANPPGDNRVGTVGTALPGVELKVDEDGELLVRGASVMQGYLDNPVATAACLDEDGWLRTGDLARIDEEGYVTLLGRKKDLIIRGGTKLYPEEIEEVLLRHPAVAEACVVGLPDPALEEVPVAVIVPRSPGGIDTAALTAHCRAEMALYKVPRMFRVIEALPRNPNGKVLRRAVAALVRVP